MKSYTDLEQSRKLAEILSLESANMHYNNAFIKGIIVYEYRAELMDYNTAIKLLSKYTINPLFGIIPCWSLAALIELMPLEIKICKQTDDTFIYSYIEFENRIIYLSSERHKELVDACYEMILKLHELNLL